MPHHNDFIAKVVVITKDYIFHLYIYIRLWTEYMLFASYLPKNDPWCIT